MKPRAVTSPDKTGRARAARLWAGEPCEVCGMPYGGRGRVQRHHIDSNRMNNERYNIRFLCVKHHKEAHQASDRAVGGGARPRIVALMRDRARTKAALAAELRRQGRSSSEIAAVMGVDQNSVNRWFRKYGEPSPSSPTPAAASSRSR